MSDFPVKAEDKVNSGAVLVIGLATTAILWASVVALQANFEDTEGELAAERESQGRSDVVRDLNTAQLRDLNQSTYADPQKGTLKRLSIENAKRVVVRDAKAGAPSLIPMVGPLNVPTIPVAAGKPALAPPAEEAPPEGATGDAPTGATPTEAAPAEAAPAGAAPAEVAPTGAAQPAPAAGTNP
jgi:hypothetical protein